MSVLIAKASGNFTTSTTWGLVDATSYLNAENATESLLTTAYSGTRSSAFTPGAITIDGIAVKLCERLGTTGTMSVQLELDVGDVAVAGTEVTIDTADLPSALEADLNGGWIFLKFSSPVLLLAATAYQVAAKTSSASMVDLWCDGTADNISRCLRTTTEQAPAAGDDMIITGEKTAAGAQTAITVTMNETATTDYGSAPTAANSLIGPGISITSGGTLSYGITAATNYYLKVSNSIIVYSGGILNVGTVGSPIPRGGTAVLELDPAADGDYGLLIRNLGTCNIQGLSRTSGKNIYYCLLNTDEAANSTSLGVDTDTGWLDNDVIAVAATSRTPADSESGALNGNAGASSLTVDGFAGAGGGLFVAHSGTSPYQAEVILLTRNVMFRSATSTIMTYFYAAPTASVDIDWVDFRYIGENASTKRGIEIATTTGSFNIQYCSIRNTEDQALYSSSASGSNIVISNNIFYKTNTAVASSVFAIEISATTGVITFTNNISVTSNSANATTAGGMRINDLGSTYTGNRIIGHTAGSSSPSVSLTESATITGTISGFVIRSSDSFGLTINGTLRGTISTLFSCRNGGGPGVNFIGGNPDYVILDTPTLQGNSNNGINSQTPVGELTVIGGTFNGDATFSQANGINISSGSNIHEVFLVNCSFGATTAHTTADLTIAANCKVYAFNTTFASSTEVVLTNYVTSFLKSQKNDASGTTFKNTYLRGVIREDTTIRNTASGYSWKLTPSSATEKLIIPGPRTWETFKVAVNASTLVTIQVYVYKDSSYNGNAPRLVLVGGIVGGITSDVTDSLTVAHSNWEQLEVTGTPNEAGVVEFYVDCDGTAGNVYVDDISVSQA